MSETLHERRERLKREVDEDLRKEIAHLLTDIHEESVSGVPTSGVPLLRELARFASLLGRLYLKAEIQTAKVIRLTWGLFGLTIALVILTAALLGFTIYLAQDAYLNDKRAKQERKDRAEPDKSNVETHSITVPY
jgi:hypothetical protein